MSASRSLKTRWYEPEGSALLQLVVSALRNGGDLGGVEVPKHNGLLDLRGIPLPAALSRIDGAVFQGIDFSGAGLANINFARCELINCVFDRADCRGWRLGGSSLRRCSMVAADLRESDLGRWADGLGNLYEQVDFSKAKLRRMSSAAATYVDCDFASADLREVNFFQSSLIRCRFAGALERVIFDGRVLGTGKGDPNPMENVDFSAATFSGVEFRGVPLASVRLPADSDLFLIKDSSVLAEMRDIMSRVYPQDTVDMVAEHAARLLQMGQPALINFRDVGLDSAQLDRLLPPGEAPIRLGRA